MKKILVLGATSGIAEAFMHQALKHGYQVILASRNRDKLKILAEDLRISYDCPELAHEFFDAEDAASHALFLSNIIERHEGIDGCFIACGVLFPQQDCECDFELTRQTIAVNYTGLVSIMNLLADYFEKKQAGFISCITSVAGDRGRGSNYIYGSTKAALNAYLSGLRVRLSKSSVFVQTIKSGPVDTSMNSSIENPPLMVSPDQAGREIWHAFEKEKEIVYIPWFWKYIMFVICRIPEFIFKKMRF